MKNEELHEIIKNIRRGGLSKGGALGHHSGINDEIADLLEKQIPKKPLEEHFFGIGKCPNCNAAFLDKSTKYCGNCGQALDWSDEDEK